VVFWVAVAVVLAAIADGIVLFLALPQAWPLGP
jgi:hypothetical protein